MINKSALREYIYNNTLSGDLDDKTFYIVPSWSFIRECNDFQDPGMGDDSRTCNYCGEYLDNCKCQEKQSPFYTPNEILDFDHLLSFIDSEYPFPVNETDIQMIIHNLDILESIQNGQMSFIDWEWSLEFSPDIARTILTKYNDNLENDPIYWVNDFIKDEIGESEWGFDDEYTLCSECSNTVIRTSPDSYGWSPEYYETDYGIFCKECAQDYLDSAIQEIQERIDHNKSPKSLPWIFDLTDDWMEVKHPRYEHSKWESGLHPGMNDDPLRQGRIVRSIRDSNNNSLFQIVFRIYPSQFSIEWDTFIRFNPDIQDIPNIDLESVIESLANQFDSPAGRTPYDLGELMSKALQQSSKSDTAYNKISVNPETGEIHIDGTNDLEDYLAK